MGLPYFLRQQGGAVPVLPGRPLHQLLRRERIQVQLPRQAHLRWYIVYVFTLLACVTLCLCYAAVLREIYVQLEFSLFIACMCIQHLSQLLLSFTRPNLYWPYHQQRHSVHCVCAGHHLPAHWYVLIDLIVILQLLLYYCSYNERTKVITSFL